MKRLLLMGFLVFSLTASFSMAEKFKPTIDYSGIPMLITTYVFGTRAQMYKALKARGIDVSSVLIGKAIWREWVNKKTGKSIMRPDKIPSCEIYVVKPKRVDGTAILIMGHELTHCIYGSFHEIN